MKVIVKSYKPTGKWYHTEETQVELQTIDDVIDLEEKIKSKIVQEERANPIKGKAIKSKFFFVFPIGKVYSISSLKHEEIYREKHQCRSR